MERFRPSVGPKEDGVDPVVRDERVRRRGEETLVGRKRRRGGEDVVHPIHSAAVKRRNEVLHHRETCHGLGVVGKIVLRRGEGENIYLHEYCYCNHLHSLKLPVGTMFSS